MLWEITCESDDWTQMVSAIAKNVNIIESIKELALFGNYWNEHQAYVELAHIVSTATVLEKVDIGNQKNSEKVRITMTAKEVILTRLD